MPGMHAPGSPAADSDADMELSSPDPMSSVQSLGFALELPAECVQVMVSHHHILCHPGKKQTIRSCCHAGVSEHFPAFFPFIRGTSGIFQIFGSTTALIVRYLWSN